MKQWTFCTCSALVGVLALCGTKNALAVPLSETFVKTCINLEMVTHSSSNEEFDACVKQKIPKPIWERSSEAERFAAYEGFRAEHAEKMASISLLEERYAAAISNSSDVSVGEWAVMSEADPITDVVIARLALVATSGETKLGEPITLHLRCDDGVTEAFINWNSYMTDSAEVITRVDKNTPQTKQWNSDTSKTASFYPKTPHPEGKLEYRDGSDGRSPGRYVIQIDAQPFVKELVAGSKLVARATPYNEAPITATWDLTGIIAASKDLREACGF